MHEQRVPGPGPDPDGLVEQFGNMGIEQCFGTPQQRIEFLRSMSAAEYHSMLSWANAKICGLGRQERGFAPLDQMAPINNANGAPRYFGLVGASRITMLDRAFHTAQELDDPEYAGALIATSIVATRPFAAGNDTTARLAHDMLTRGFTGSQEDVEHYTGILQHSQAATVFDGIERAGLGRRFAYQYTLHILNIFGVPQELRPLSVSAFVDQDMGQLRELPPGDVRRELYDLAGEPGFNRPILTEFILHSGRDLRDFLIADHQDNLHINALQLVNDVRPEERELLLGIFEHVKAQFMQTVIDCFKGEGSIYGSPDLIVEQFRRSLGDFRSERERGPAPSAPPSAGGYYDGPPPHHHAETDPILAAIHRTRMTMDPYGQQPGF